MLGIRKFAIESLNGAILGGDLRKHLQHNGRRTQRLSQSCPYRDDAGASQKPCTAALRTQFLLGEWESDEYTRAASNRVDRNNHRKDPQGHQLRKIPILEWPQMVSLGKLSRRLQEHQQRQLDISGR